MERERPASGALEEQDVPPVAGAGIVRRTWRNALQRRGNARRHSGADARLEISGEAACVIGGLTTNNLATPVVSNDPHGDFGVDAKRHHSQPDLRLHLQHGLPARVEEDEQQVNLTRFSQFFPERRDFFLEGQGSSSLRVFARAVAAAEPAKPRFGRAE